MDSRHEEYSAEIEWIKAYFREHPVTPRGLEFKIDIFDDGEKWVVKSPHFPEFETVLYDATATDAYYALCEWIRNTYHISPQGTVAQP